MSALVLGQAPHQIVAGLISGRVPADASRIAGIKITIGNFITPIFYLPD